MKKLIFYSFLMLALPAVADLQADMINDRLDRLDREMTLMQKKVYTEVRPVSAAVDGGTDFGELYAQLDAQNQALAEMTRKMEEIAHEQENLKAELSLLKEDLAVRFREQEPKVTAPMPPSKKPSDKEAYDRAYNLLVKTKYEEAEKALRDFIAEYPESSYVGNANYWLGETYYVRGQYEVAAGIFSDGLTKYESSPKAPDNLLKLGLSMAQLNKKAEACGFLTLLPEKYPKANQTLKKRAEQEAKKLSCP